MRWDAVPVTLSWRRHHALESVRTLARTRSACGSRLRAEGSRRAQSPSFYDGAGHSLERPILCDNAWHLARDCVEVGEGRVEIAAHRLHLGCEPWVHGADTCRQVVEICGEPGIVPNRPRGAHTSRGGAWLNLHQKPKTTCALRRSRCRAHGLGAAHSDLGPCRRVMRGGCWGWEGWGIDYHWCGVFKTIGLRDASFPGVLLRSFLARGSRAGPLVC